MRAVFTAVPLAVLLAAPASPALAAEDGVGLFPAQAPAWHLSFDGHDPEPVAIHPSSLPAFMPESDSPLPARPFETAMAVQGAPPPKAFVYSEAYEFRHKVHKYASWATVPLFVSQAIVGQQLYDGDGSGSLKTAHSVLAGLTGALFAVNTVTGVWNLWEGWDNPTGRTKRLTHGLLMLGASAAFLATAGTAPESEHGGVEGNKSAHRNAALVGFSSASVGYVLMLLSR
jgi:hypothetical protein